MISVNGINMSPSPDGFKVGLNDIVKGERNANGTMVIDRISTKAKLELSWAKLSAAELAGLLAQVQDVFFSVTYPDPNTAGGTRTATFYAGDKGAQGITYQNGVMTWKDFKFNMIER